MPNFVIISTVPEIMQVFRVAGAAGGHEVLAVEPAGERRGAPRRGHSAVRSAADPWNARIELFSCWPRRAKRTPAFWDTVASSSPAHRMSAAVETKKDATFCGLSSRLGIPTVRPRRADARNAHLPAPAAAEIFHHLVGGDDLLRTVVCSADPVLTNLLVKLAAVA
mmetsp:Transcript_31249/g.48321  ORF Transcript_31249/g.48321 Transcript_31249/m.48321 type:complete len:166 (-) Transcript_31249:38-535(-)